MILVIWVISVIGEPGMGSCCHGNPRLHGGRLLERECGMGWVPVVTGTTVVGLRRQAQEET